MIRVWLTDRLRKSRDWSTDGWFIDRPLLWLGAIRACPIDQWKTTDGPMGSDLFV